MKKIQVRCETPNTNEEIWIDFLEIDGKKYRLVDESECEHDWQSCSDNFGNAWEQCIKCNQIKCNQKKESEPNPVANESYANENTESKKIEKPPILDHSMTDFYDVLDNRELMIKIINHLNKDL